MKGMDGMHAEDRTTVARLLRVVEAAKSHADAPDNWELANEHTDALDAVTDADLQTARVLAGRYE